MTDEVSSVDPAVGACTSSEEPSQCDLDQIIDSRKVESALLQYQFFPNVRTDRPEVAPFFASETFTPEFAKNLCDNTVRPKYAPVLAFRARRYDGLLRELGLPHPVPYARLVKHIVNHWEDLSPLLGSRYSGIQPTPNAGNDRIVVMDYEIPSTRLRREAIAAQGKRYVVSADISSCFPSVYSHAIDWALRGKAAAKKSRNNKSWEGELDRLVRNCHDRETKGIMIGPAASNLLSELILQRVDGELANAGYEFTRYIDDFTSFHSTLQDAEGFISCLDRNLSKYRLQLNSRKTRIRSIDDGFGDEWITDVIIALPRKKRSGTVRTLRYLHDCERLSRRYPQKSVLTFGVKTLMNRRKCPELGKVPIVPCDVTDVSLLEELIRLTYIYPHLASFMVRQMSYCVRLLSRDDKNRIAEQLRYILEAATRRRETDTVTWLVYAIRKLLRRDINKKLARSVMAMDDDVAWLSLMCCGKKYVSWVRAYADQLLAEGEHQKVEHWLVRYELYRTNILQGGDLDEDCEAWFKIGRAEGVRFTALK